LVLQSILINQSYIPNRSKKTVIGPNYFTLLDRTSKMAAFNISENSSDYFAALTTDGTNKQWRNFSIIFSVFSFTVIPVALYSIIWFEKYGCDSKRTVLNRIASIICWTGFEYLFFIQIFETLRFVYGPLPKAFCFFTRYLKRILVVL